jgi:hypothetical protein
MEYLLLGRTVVLVALLLAVALIGVLALNGDRR